MKEILILVSKHEIFIQLLINLFKYMHRIIIPVPRFKSIFNGCFGFWFLLLFGSKLLSQREESYSYIVRFWTCKSVKYFEFGAEERQERHLEV